MAFIQCDLFSETLKLSTNIHVVVPEFKAENNLARRHDQDTLLPVLYLLHGLSDDHTIWTRATSIERYAEEKGLIVVMPAVGRSYYQDMRYGLKYWTYITEELPKFCKWMFPISGHRKDTFVAGLSMGGYGAFKCVLNYPDRYAAGASLSGALDIQTREKLNIPDFKAIFGEEGFKEKTAADLFYMAEQLTKYPGPKPKLFQCCGTEDFIYEDNVKFRKHLVQLGLELTYEEGPGGHTWEYWDQNIKRVLDWLPIQANEETTPGI